MSKTDRRLRSISLILIAVLIFTALFNVVYVGRVAGASISKVLAPSSASSNNGLVKTDMNFDNIREQYFNQELVQKNIASYEGDRWIIVELDGETLYDKFAKSSRYSDFATFAASTEGQNAQANLKADHADFLKRLERHGIDYQLRYNYTAIANALAIKVNAEAFNSITKMNGVVDAYYVDYYDVPKTEAVTNNANVYTTGIYKTDGIKEQGEGMTVAILDTGLDYTHEAFQMELDENKIAFNKEYIENIVANGRNDIDIKGTGNGTLLEAKGTANELFYSNKVPFAYDYADDDTNVYPSYSSHGTHVAGIVAGQSKYEVVKGEEFKGVAPKAQLVICKVFTDNLDSTMLGGASTMGILAALNDCAVLGVDVINMSLGSSAGFTEERATDAQTLFSNAVYKAIEDLGISLIVAASNDFSSGFGGSNGTNLASNPDSGTVGSPSTYSAALSVASINGRKASYFTGETDAQVAFITNSSDEFGQEFDFVEQLYQLAEKTRGQKIERGTSLKFKYIPVGGIGRESDYNAVSNLFNVQTAVSQGYDGVIAFVKRGTSSFADKVRIAKMKGAQACVIYNNVGGTIRMSLGDLNNPIPACSISMDAGDALVKAVNRSGYGTMIVNSEYQAGPFMSDFSSWGPTPNLELKPEITAHGGEIISAVAGGYDKLSGTSMASPNMAGAVALLRQNLKNRDEYKNWSGKQLNALVNQMLMSTAVIANNENGNPYSPRKQGAGLADIKSAINSEGYITVLDSNGDTKDKTKIELYDTSKKTGVYTLDFVMHNTTGESQQYNPTTYVMTETMSTDRKTVAEKAYMLNDNCTIKYYVGNNVSNLVENNGTIVVKEHSELSVRVVITLNDQAKQYLDKNFVNGMYVEGFVSMKNVDSNKVTLGVPYLGFYGDWTAAPLFDYDVYEIAEDEQDTGLDDYYKRKASAAATTVVGLYYEDRYAFPLGTYIYEQAETDIKIYPERDKIAISKFDDDSGRSVYELYNVSAGLLRGAAEMEVVITDDATGETIYKDTLYNVRKSYAGSGSNRGGPIMLEIKPDEWGLANNSSYSVKIKGKLDYEGGDNPKRNTFEFPFTVDYEEPEILDYRIRYMPSEYDSVTKKPTKYRIYMDIDVRDNQYVQSIIPGYREKRSTGIPDDPSTLRDESFEYVFTSYTDYPIAVSGQKGETTTVSWEITEIFDDIVNSPLDENGYGKLFIQVDDYALNSTNYNIIIGKYEGEDAMMDPVPGSIELTPDQYLKKGAITEKDALGNEYYVYTLSLPPYTPYTLNATCNGEAIDLKSLTWNTTKATSAQGNGNDLYVGNGADATLTLTSTTATASARTTYAKILVMITGGQGGKMPLLQSIQFKPAINKDGGLTSLSGTLPRLTLNPGQSVLLDWTWSPWYCEKPEVVWSSDDPDIVSVDKNGRITAKKRGETSIYVKTTRDDNVVIQKGVIITVGREYDISNYTLRDHYGTGVINIPSNLNIMYLNEYCFRGRTDITKVILPTTLTEIPENAFLGCTNLKEIVIPGQCTTIRNNAFAGCTSLEKITLGMYVDSDKNFIEGYYGTLTVGRNAFYGCTSLKTIQMYSGDYSDSVEVNESHLRLTTLGAGAFAGCTSLEKIDLTNARVVARGVFNGCTKLKTVVVGKDTEIGVGMFENCTALESIEYNADTVPANAFKGCENLSTITFGEQLFSIGSNAFSGTLITEVTLPNSNVELAANAFAASKLRTLKLNANTTLTFASGSAFTDSEFSAYELVEQSDSYSVVDGALYGDNGKTLISVPYKTVSFTMPADVETIASGALAGVNIESIDLSNVKNIGGYAFAGNTSVKSVVLPSALTEIPAGLFEGCTSLNSVTGCDNIEKVGDNAFKGCTALARVTMPKVKNIGASAFEESGLTSVPSADIVSIGASAFAKSKLVDAVLPKSEKLGDGAFANISTLKSVEFGGITEFGTGVFVGSTQITSAIFGNGTKEIGAEAFKAEKPLSVRIQVTLPSSVEKIGDEAFFDLKNLTINLGNVKHIGQMAFAYFNSSNTNDRSNLSNVNLEKVEYIGESAFSCTSITDIKLLNAKHIASYAFDGCNALKTVTLGALEKIETYAFYGASIESITLPASFGKTRTYNYKWIDIDFATGDKTERQREVEVYSPAALAVMPYLKEIKVEGNGVFFAVDGVLYSKTKNGYVLEQYPTGKTDKEYTPIDGTIMIAEKAFEKVQYLESVEIPYSVKTIGSGAFYDTPKLKTYVFNSVEAPKLLSQQIYNYEANNEMSQIFFDRNYLGRTNFYSNFYGYAIEADVELWEEWEEKMKEDGFTFPANYPPYDFELTMVIPRNGRGYDGVWNLFFSTINLTENNMPDDTSHKAMEAIDAAFAKVGNIDAIASMSYEAINESSEIGLLAKAARVAYDSIQLTEQIEVVKEYYNKLIDLEKALRSRKAALGHPVAVTKLDIVKPIKTRYKEGEAFDPTGMVVTAVFADGSKLVLGENEYSIEPRIIGKGVKSVKIVYVDSVTNKSVEAIIQLNVSGSVENNPGTETGNGNTKLSGGAIAGIVIGVIAALAGVAAAVVLVILNKKGLLKKNSKPVDSIEDKSEAFDNTIENAIDTTEQSADASAEKVAESDEETQKETVEEATADLTDDKNDDATHSVDESETQENAVAEDNNND